MTIRLRVAYDVVREDKRTKPLIIIIIIIPWKRYIRWHVVLKLGFYGSSSSS